MNPGKRSRSSSEDEEPRKLYVIEKVDEQKVRKYGVEEYTYKAKFNDDVRPENLTEVRDGLRDMFGDMVENIAQNYNPDDRVRLSIHHAALDKEITIHLQPRRNITADTILERFEAVVQSKQEVTVDETFEVKVGTMRKEQQGSGRENGMGIVNTDNESKDCSARLKRCMIFIHPIKDDKMCAARAIVTALAKCRKEDRNRMAKLVTKKLINTDNPLSQKNRAARLLLEVGLPKDRAVSVRELYLFELHLDVQIIVVSGDLLNQISYKGYHTREDKLYLYLKDDHYHVITRMDGFFPEKKFCTGCLQFYGRKKKHYCDDFCFTCQTKGCRYSESKLTCQECNMLCRNDECYTRHKTQLKYSRGVKNGEVKGPPLCQTVNKCPTCEKVVDVSKRDMGDHQCGEWYCKMCKSHVVGEHFCFYRIKLPKQTSGKFIFYDFECSQDKIMTCQQGYLNAPIQGCPQCAPDQLCPKCRRCINCNRPYCGLARHTPNFLVCQSVCDLCENDDWSDDAICRSCGDRCKVCFKKDKNTGDFVDLCNNDTCGRREAVFKGAETAENFCKWLFRPVHSKKTAIAHNFRGYDSYFLLNYCINNSITPEVVFAGSKVMTMKVKEGLDITFIDSLNFLPLPLRKLPDALGLSSQLRKGDFPHLFNTQVNFNYIGPFPSQYYFSPQFMAKSVREEFLEWHEKQKERIFDFQQEILAYTRSDVRILREGCMKFRALIKNATTVAGSESPPVDAFAHATIASSAMQIMRQLIMREEHWVCLTDGKWRRASLKAGNWTDYDTGEPINRDDVKKNKFIKSDIPQIPAHGYRPNCNHSVKSIIWLEWEAKKLGRRLQHARNGGEFKIPGTNYRADGYDQATGTVYEFYGCRWHGHGCFPSRDVRDPRTNYTMSELLMHTRLREKAIMGKGYRLEKMWECQFDLECHRNPELKAFTASFDVPPPLTLRDSLTGGRTSPVVLFHECREGEKIRYFDVCSLYPYINLTGKYPICHPEIITDESVMDPTLESYYGLVKIKILPPRQLYLPVLPYRSNGKLKFPLCRKCSETESTRQCQCTVEERALTGTWTTEEVKASTQRGYRIMRIYEIYHYPETTQFDKTTGQGGLFTDYVKMFLKIKQQASGYPSSVTTEQDKDAYIKEYRHNQGVALEKELICKNPGLRFVSKLYLNSCWGKFCERQNKLKCLFVKTPLELAQLQNDPTREVVDFHIINENIIAVEIKNTETFLPENAFTNEVLGSITTSLARLHLYRIIEQTGEKTLYFDTDSVIFVEDGETNVPQTGVLLGELTDELKDGTHIKIFASSGPKSYGYLTSDGESVIKLKGISMNFSNSDVITFDVIKRIVLDELACVKTPSANQITRDKFSAILYNRPMSKVYKKVFTKRVLIPGCYKSVPYGYIGKNTAS